MAENHFSRKKRKEEKATRLLTAGRVRGGGEEVKSAVNGVRRGGEGGGHCREL